MNCQDRFISKLGNVVFEIINRRIDNGTGQTGNGEYHVSNLSRLHSSCRWLFRRILSTFNVHLERW